MDDVRCGAWARELGLVVASVDNRLAPEHPFPAAHVAYLRRRLVAPRLDGGTDGEAAPFAAADRPR